MLCYIAYPTSLKLQSANALQTHATLRELRRLHPEMLALIPRMGREPTRFAEVGACHLPRPAIGKLSRLHRSSLWYYLEYSIFAWMCAAAVARQPVEAVYVRQNICAAWWSSVFGPRMGIPVIYEAHDLELRNPSRAKEPWAQGFVHLIDRVALTRATAVASLTADFRRYLAGIGWRDPADVHVIPDAYDDTLFVPHERHACRAALHLPTDAAIIAYAGMSFAHRWLDGLLDAAAHMLAQHPHLLLLLVGGRPAERAALQQHAAALGISRHVVLVEPRPQADVVRYLAAADVLVIPDTLTDTTASPLKLFEYLAMGQPLVLPDIPALREIVPPDAGCYFPRRQTAALAHALGVALHHASSDPAGVAVRRALAQQHTYARRAERILGVVAAVSGG